MKNKLTGTLMVSACVLLMSAFGGGGRFPGATGGAGAGTTTGGRGGTTTTASASKITIALFNGTTLMSSISASGVTIAKATAADDKKNPVLGKLVTFSGDANLISLTLASGAVLTDADTGIATVQITPAKVVPSTGGAGVFTLNLGAILPPAA